MKEPGLRDSGTPGLGTAGPGWMGSSSRGHKTIVRFSDSCECDGGHRGREQGLGNRGQFFVLDRDKWYPMSQSRDMGHPDAGRSERFVVSGGEDYVGGGAAPADAEIADVVESEGSV